MEEIVTLIICVFTIFLFKVLFKVSLQKARELEENEHLKRITDKFPENIEIAKDMLNMLGNNNVTIEQQKNTKTSLYIAVTNKILIADLKDNYARIQTIAHECIHSVQEKTLLLFNFIFSNITIVCFILVAVLTMCKVYTNFFFQLFVLLLLFFVQFAVRSFLEIDAMTKSKYLAKEYIEKKNLCTEEEIKQLIIEYDKINKMGIAFTLYKLFSNALIKIVLLDIVFCITNNI